jgi:short-subunit dehydrogenase
VGLFPPPPSLLSLPISLTPSSLLVLLARLCAAALDHYLEAARLENRGTSIHFTTFNPGFIETEMTSVVKRKPYVISSEKCAQLMFNEIQKKTVKTVIPWWPWILFAWFAAWLPDRSLAVFGPRNVKKQ